MPELSTDEVASLRDKHYNAELLKIIEVHEELRILRVRPDEEPSGFEAGQYTTLGLGYWEPRIAGVDEEVLTPEQSRKLVRRAYSFASPMLDDDGALLPPLACDFREFYVVLVKHAEEHPPGLTPRLFALQEGGRLHLGKKSTGHYTLGGVVEDDQVVLISTGTGEAPHTAMVAELLHRGHAGRIACVSCVRRRRDLGYAAAFRQLEVRYEQVRYLTLTTREPENLDPQAPGYVGKRYLQEYLLSGDLERDAELTVDPQTMHVFLCGNPAMIGAPVRGAEGADRFPQPQGMVEILETRGFLADEPHRPGNIHYEKYW